MGPGQNFLTRVGSGWLSHLWFGFDFGKFPIRRQIFNFFLFRLKKISSGWVKKYPGHRWSASYLLRVKSKLWSGKVRAHLYSVVLIILLAFFCKHVPISASLLIKLLQKQCPELL